MDQQNSDELVSVFMAPDEITAHLVKGILEEAGIQAIVSSRQVPWMDGIMTNAQGYWGDVMVPESQSRESLAIIRDFRSAEPDENMDDPDIPPEADVD
jgi:hypothetical protein